MASVLRRKGGWAFLWLLIALLACNFSPAIAVVPAGVRSLGEPVCEGTDSSNDWLARLPEQHRRIRPAPCETGRNGALFSWGEPVDRNRDRPWRFLVRRVEGGEILQRTVDAPRLVLNPSLPSGDYEWRVLYDDKRGVERTSDWRRFRVLGTALAATDTARRRSAELQDLPKGAVVAAQLLEKSRPRVLPMGSDFRMIASAAQAADFKPVLVALRSNAATALKRIVPTPPRLAPGLSDVDRVAAMRTVQHTAGGERESISILALLGRVDSDAELLGAGRERLLALAAWPADTVAAEKDNNLANREVYLGLAIGLDLLWTELDAAQRTAVVAAMRARILPAVGELSYLDTVPYEPHRVSKTRWLVQALMLGVGLPEFPEARGLLERLWDLSRFTLGAFGDIDGSYANGIAYGWYSFIQVVPHVAAVRAMTGIDLYDIPFLRRAGEQLIAFTPPDHPQTSAFGDETETTNLYRNNASNFYRLHAQMTRDPVDAWYWQVRPGNVDRPALQLIWQLLLLGADSRPLPRPVPPGRHSWFSKEAGLAAVHDDMSRSARTSLFFRSSQFGAFNHAHADQNAFVYVVRGTPLLIGGGYYPYYGSPHHRIVGRATRYKNALTFDGGIGQAESRIGADAPTEPLHSMDAHGRLLRADDLGGLAVVTGDATPAYRAFDAASGKSSPLLTQAIRSVVVDRASGVVFVYDWATSARPRRWELNLHAPQPFVWVGKAVKAAANEASVCVDYEGPAADFGQTSAWDVAPEIPAPQQAHGRFTVQAPSLEFAALTVLRADCTERMIRVQRTDARITVSYNGKQIEFGKADVSIR